MFYECYNKLGEKIGWARSKGEGVALLVGGIMVIVMLVACAISM